VNNRNRGLSPFITHFFLLLLFLFASSLQAEELRFANGWSVYPPVGWELIAAEDEKLTFAPPGESAYFQIKRYPGDSYESIKEMTGDVIKKAGAESNGSEYFRWLNRDASFNDIILFPGDGIAFRGYLIVIEGFREDIALLTLAAPDQFDSLALVLLSVLDSFSIGERSALYPGPVAAYLFQETESERLESSISFMGESYQINYLSRDIDATAYLVEREAAILQTYTGSELAEEAWRRYYRMIYRDSYHRLDPLHSLFRDIFRKQKASKESLYDDREIARLLLQWIQRMNYHRGGGVSDLDGPLLVAVEGEGDCDSRGILLAALLNEMEIASILMVSSQYGHSMVAVDIEGNGARFTYKSRPYVVAETTEEVELGMIDSSMADPQGWIGIDFFHYSR
jgi:hypothetical protein